MLFLWIAGSYKLRRWGLLHWHNDRVLRCVKIGWLVHKFQWERQYDMKILLGWKRITIHTYCGPISMIIKPCEFKGSVIFSVVSCELQHVAVRQLTPLFLWTHKYGELCGRFSNKTVKLVSTTIRLYYQRQMAIAHVSPASTSTYP